MLWKALHVVVPWPHPSYLGAMVFAVLSFWKGLPSHLHLVHSLPSCRSLLKCHLLRQHLLNGSISVVNTADVLTIRTQVRHCRISIPGMESRAGEENPVSEEADLYGYQVVSWQRGLGPVTAKFWPWKWVENQIHNRETAWWWQR